MQTTQDDWLVSASSPFRTPPKVDGVVKERLKRQTPEFQMGDFFMTGVNNVKGALGIHDRGVDVENAIKMAAADDGFVTYEELRENLRA